MAVGSVKVVAPAVIVLLPACGSESTKPEPVSPLMLPPIVYVEDEVNVALPYSYGFWLTQFPESLPVPITQSPP
jgi:hypothetical protein